ncbi:tyrosine-protein phosphatase [Cellulomonas fengjieae]|uniref:tyrosine-protein phosphatase n=1 Tax=Cellulomonas fengjieae TaxID=2819978 RepID=UPI001AAE89D4|nr:tyrosine-protein phosphatase [Cellulomonas fengjieae]MBO3102171.1 tyrosine-protein phosphatase [Cellulomonas fengjieae]
MTVDPHVLLSPAVTNLRDLGGRPTADGGRVATGVAYRSAELAAPSVATDAALADLAVRTVVDLRTQAERSARPDHVPAGATLVELDVLADLPQGPAAQLPALLVGGRVDALARLDLAAQMLTVYRQLVVGDAARRGYAALVRIVIDPQRQPVLFHCTAGKDRTGWAATILLLAAGVDQAGVLEEFLAVNPAVRETFAPLLQQFGAAGGDPDLLRPMLEVRAEYLEVALDVVRERFGSFDGYLTDGLGLSPLEIGTLHRTMRADG